MGCGQSKVSPEQALAANTADPRRYNEPDAIWAALGMDWVKLVRKSYLISLSKAGGVLPRRQDIPPDAFITVEELRRLTPKDEYGQAHTRVGVGYTRPPGLISKNTYLPIIVISFCWLTAKHPDPEGKQLKVVAERLENHLAQDTEVGVFWDWAVR